MNFQSAISKLCTQTIGITGATGVIGSALVERLIRENPRIQLNILKRKTSKLRLRWNRIATQYPQNLRIIEGDLLCIEALHYLVQQNDIIFHIGLDSRDNFASREFGINKKSYEILVANTIPGTVLSFWTGMKNKPFIFTSSYGVYFHVSPPPKGKRLREEDARLDKDLERNMDEFVSFLKSSLPKIVDDDEVTRGHAVELLYTYLEDKKFFQNLSNHQLYAVQKLINENIVKEYPHALSLRIGNIYGPGDAPGRPVPVFLDKVKAGGTQHIANDRRSYIYIDDVVEALLRAAIVSEVGLEQEDRVVTVAHPKVLSSLYVAETIKDVLGRNTLLRVTTTQENEHLELDLSRMLSVLGVDPSTLVSLEDGLKKTIAACI